MEDKAVAQVQPSTQCDYKLVKTKRKGEKCKRASTKTHKGLNYCLYHYRMISTSDVNDTPMKNRAEKSIDVNQLQFPLEDEAPKKKVSFNENDYLSGAKKKRKRPIYNDDKTSSSSSSGESDVSDDEIEFGNAWSRNEIDFGALERMCMDAFHRNNRA